MCQQCAAYTFLITCRNTHTHTHSNSYREYSGVPQRGCICSRSVQKASLSRAVFVFSQYVCVCVWRVWLPALLLFVFCHILSASLKGWFMSGCLSLSCIPCLLSPIGWSDTNPLQSESIVQAANGLDTLNVSTRHLPSMWCYHLVNKMHIHVLTSGKDRPRVSLGSRNCVKTPITPIHNRRGIQLKSNNALLHCTVLMPASIEVMRGNKSSSALNLSWPLKNTSFILLLLFIICYYFIGPRFDKVSIFSVWCAISWTWGDSFAFFNHRGHPAKKEVTITAIKQKSWGPLSHRRTKPHYHKRIFVWRGLCSCYSVNRS